MVSTASFIVNHSPRELWFSKPGDKSILRVFSCPSYYHVCNGKLDHRVKKCVFLGYEFGVKGYGLWSPSDKKLAISCNVVFDETYMFCSSREEATTRVIIPTLPSPSSLLGGDDSVTNFDAPLDTEESGANVLSPHNLNVPLLKTDLGNILDLP